jgi:RHS repeat-associated protein
MAPFGETYASIGSSDLTRFSDMTQDSSSGLFDTPNREYSAGQGRWLSPDPAGIAAVNMMNPQSWNRYAFVLNNPLLAIDPTGLDCAYLNDKGDGIESVDQNSNSTECSKNGGYWVDGGLTDYQIDAERGIVTLWGATQGCGYGPECGGLDNQQATFAQYQDTTATVGWFMNSSANPFGHVAISVNGGPYMGLGPSSDFVFALKVAARYNFFCDDSEWCFQSLQNAIMNVKTPGAITEEDPTKEALQSVSIPITGMQANAIQNSIIESSMAPPTYSIGQAAPACDCGTWIQQILSSTGVNSGPPAPVPAVLIEQLNQIYYPF